MSVWVSPRLRPNLQHHNVTEHAAALALPGAVTVGSGCVPLMDRPHNTSVVLPRLWVSSGAADLTHKNI